MTHDTGAPRSLVVYESMFGNTAAVAQAIADGLATRITVVDVTPVSSAPVDLDGVGLLVVGGPTHAFGMTRAKTRAAAKEQGATGPTARGIRDWLDNVTRPTNSVPAACFDTRIRKPFLLGSAARGMRRRLRRAGFDVRTVESFTVTGTPGPLAHGELERARQWGADLVGSAVPATAGSS